MKDIVLHISLVHYLSFLGMKKSPRISPGVVLYLEDLSDIDQIRI